MFTHYEDIKGDKMQKLGWFDGLGVPRGHRQHKLHNHSIEHIRLQSIIIYLLKIKSNGITGADAYCNQAVDVDVEDVLAQAMCLFASFSSTNDQNML